MTVRFVHLHDSHVTLWKATKIKQLDQIEKPSMTPLFQSMLRTWKKEHRAWRKSLDAASTCPHPKTIWTRDGEELSCKGFCPGEENGVLPIGRCVDFSGIERTESK